MNQQPVDLSPAPVVRDGKPYLVIRNVTKRFGSFLALDDVSLDVHRGEFVSFLGPSGCGKTTLLRAISGLDIQNAGTINRMATFHACLSARGISASSFSPMFFPNLSVRDNVAYGLVSEAAAGGDQPARDRIAGACRPDQPLNFHPAVGCQQQRVALARALASPVCCYSTSHSASTRVLR